MSKTAGIVVIGNEILSGRTRDENAAFFLRELRGLGVDVRKVAIVPDEVAAIRDEVRAAAASFDYVFTSGGVGPTHDDVTIAGIAAAFDRPLHRSSEMEAVIRAYYQEKMTGATLRMADLPEGTSLVRADGMCFPVLAVENVYIFPGVPEILAAKFDRIKERFRQRPFHAVELFMWADEGRVAPLLDEAVRRFPAVRLGSYPAYDHPGYSLKLVLESKDPTPLDEGRTFLLAGLAALSIVVV